MVNFIHFRKGSDWTYERSPKIVTEYNNLIQLIPNECYLQYVSSDSDLNITENNNLETANENGVFTTSATGNTVNFIFGQIQVGVTAGNSLNLDVNPQSDFSNKRYLDFSFRVEVDGLSDVIIEFVNLDTSNVFYSQTENVTIANFDFTFNVSNLNIEGNENFKIVIRSTNTNQLQYALKEFNLKAFTLDLDNIKIIDCNNKEVDAAITTNSGNDNPIIEWTLYDNYLDRLLRFTDGVYYSNYFVCDDYKCEFTSIIHYQKTATNCFCDDVETYTNSIRLNYTN